MKVALLLPDGVGVRNFLLGSFRRAAKQRGVSLAVLHRIPDTLRGLYQESEDERIEWHEYRVYRDTPKLFMLRNVHSFAHQYSVDTWGMKCFREIPMQRGLTLRRRAAGHLVRFLGRCASGPRGVRWLDRRVAAAVAQLPETTHYRRVFEHMQPDVVLSSNQRPYGVLPAILAAQSLAIPTATCIFSWDNLTSKGRVAAPFEHYLVWSQLMQDELLQIYPDIPVDRVHIVGTPQFDPYADHSLVWSREKFFSTIGADPSRPLLCYSSGDPGNSPEDQDHTALLLELIRQGRITRNPQVLLRPTPTANQSRFANLRRRYPELIYPKPGWVPGGKEDWAQMFPTPDDVQFLANLARHTDVNVNVASTMTLDFAIHNRPVVNVAFDIASPGPFKYPLWEYYYRFEHYRPVVETGAALFSRSVDQFAEHVNTYLDNPQLHTENRRRLLDIELGVSVGHAGPCMVNALLRIASLTSPAISPVCVAGPCQPDTLRSSAVTLHSQ